MEEETFEGMPLTLAVKAWIDGEGWNDEIEVNEDRSVGSVATYTTISGQDFRLYIEAFESEQRLYIYFYTPFNAPPQRVAVVARILNCVNLRLALGRLAFNDDSKARPIQFKCAIDVEGSTLSPTQVNTLIGLGIVTFRDYGNVLAAACLTTLSFEELWLPFLLNDEDRDPSSGCPLLRVLN